MQVLLLQIYCLLTMDNDIIHIIYTDNPLDEMIDYVYTASDPVQQAMMKIYGILIGVA